MTNVTDLTQQVNMKILLEQLENPEKNSMTREKKVKYFFTHYNLCRKKNKRKKTKFLTYREPLFKRKLLLKLCVMVLVNKWSNPVWVQTSSGYKLV